MQPIQITSSNSTAFVDTNKTIASTNATCSQAQFPPVTQVSNIVELLTTSSPVYPVIDLTEPEEFSFTQQRNFVSQSLWNAFSQLLDKQSFNQFYSEFLLTNWCPTQNFKFELAEQRRIAKRHQNWIALFDQTLEVHFQQNLKLSAALLVHQILEFGKLSYQLGTPLISRNPRYTRLKKDEMQFVIEKINRNYADAYKNIYLEYKANKNIPDQEKTEEAIKKLKLQIKRMRDLITIKGMGVKNDNEISVNLSYINHMLAVLRKNTIVSHGTASKMAKAYVLCPRREAVEFSGQDEPFNKKKCTDGATLLQSTTNQTGFSQTAAQPFHFPQCNLGANYFESTAPSFDLSHSSEAAAHSFSSTSSINHFTFSQFTDQPFAPQQSTGLSLAHSSEGYPPSIQPVTVQSSQEKVNHALSSALLAPPFHLNRFKYQADSLRMPSNAFASAKRTLVQEQGIASLFPFEQVEDSIQSRHQAFKHSVAFIPNTQVLCTSPLRSFDFPPGMQEASEETTLVSMLRKIAGKEGFYYDENRVKTKTPHYPEHYYHLELMLAALNCQMNLIKMKNLTAELMGSESRRDCRKSGVIRRQIARNLTYLIDSTSIHQKITARMQCNKMHIFPENMSYTKMLCNALTISEKIKNVRITLTEILNMYSDIISIGDEKILLDRFYCLMNEKIIIATLAKNFTTLNEDKICALTRLATNIAPDSILKINQLYSLKFRVDRLAVTNQFWDLLKNGISENDFRKQFAEFILTDWKSSKVLKAKEHKKIKEAETAENFLELYNLLIDKCFQKKLELRACQLINLILVVINNYKPLNSSNHRALNNVYLMQAKNIGDINNSGNDAYLLYSKYLNERRLFQSISQDKHLERNTPETNNFLIQKIDELKSEITASQRSIHNNAACHIEKISKNIIPINRILLELENNKPVIHEELVELLCSHQTNTDSNMEAAPALDNSVSSACQVQFVAETLEEPATQHHRVSFSPQPSTSQQALDAQNTFQNPIDEQVEGLFELPPQSEQLSDDLEGQFNEFLDMDDDALVEFLASGAAFSS